LKSRKTKSGKFLKGIYSDINTVVFRDGIKGLDVLESLALLRFGSVGKLLQRWVSSVIDLLWLEIAENVSCANNIIV